MYFSKSQGFTLIDILLTAAIVSLLSSLFLFQVSEARKKADDAHMKVEAQQVSTAVALYKNDNNGKVPLSTSVPGSLYTESDPEYQETMQILVDGGYIAEIPASPDGQSYTYATDENNNAFFAFKLKQGGSSSNRKNSCSVAITSGGGTKTFTGCQQDWTNTCVQSSSVQCFPGGNSNLISYYNNCTCSNGMSSSGVLVALNPSVMPVQVCSYALSCGGSYQNLFGQTISFGPSWSLSPVSSMCNYTISGDSNTPACDGSSTSDYCECI